MFQYGRQTTNILVGLENLLFRKNNNVVNIILHVAFF